MVDTLFVLNKGKEGKGRRSGRALWCVWGNALVLYSKCDLNCFVGGEYVSFLLIYCYTFNESGVD